MLKLFKENYKPQIYIVSPVSEICLTYIFFFEFFKIFPSIFLAILQSWLYSVLPACNKANFRDRQISITVNKANCSGIGSGAAILLFILHVLCMSSGTANDNVWPYLSAFFLSSQFNFNLNSYFVAFIFYNNLYLYFFF